MSEPVPEMNERSWAMYKDGKDAATLRLGDGPPVESTREHVIALPFKYSFCLAGYSAVYEAPVILGNNLETVRAIQYAVEAGQKEKHASLDIQQKHLKERVLP